jgi:succinate-semialdehyde dehydrogenase/glutarate-semialdehyde dehydrogenase
MSSLESINPATGEVVGAVDTTPVADISAVVARARAAQPAWAERSYAERAELLRKAGELLVDRADDIGRLATQEMGKPLGQAQGEARFTAGGFGKELAAIESALAPEVMESEKVRTTIYQDPYGVVAAISPWNFPVLMPHQQVVPALAAGNTVVLKPSEQTPLTAQAYADALLEVLPADVLQVVHGADDQGKALVASDVDMIVFTGSREAGKHILGAASKDLKRVILELGGKDPLIVLDDADVAKAARFAARNSFRNAGQVCVSTERIYALPAVVDTFVEALAEAAAKMTVGNGLDEGTDIGPMVDGAQRDHVVGQVRDASEAGAHVAWRGEEQGGNFVAPVILTNVKPDMRIAVDETFGPVACIIPVEDEDDAVAKANDTPFGLGAVVFGESERARKVARRLEAGMIGVNQGLASAGDTPWVGAGQSGYGFHSGRDGHRQFTQTRVINEPK